MKGDLVETFITLAGQKIGVDPKKATPQQRALGAQLLLSEVLEYVIKGLGVTPQVKGVPITEPDGITYQASETPPNPREMLDGLADVAYTMYWNAIHFGVRLEEGFQLVCENNLEKFVRLENRSDTPVYLEGTELPRELWHCSQEVQWPAEVATVSVIKVKGVSYAVGKDKNGKVRKPSTYQSVNLEALVANG